MKYLTKVALIGALFLSPLSSVWASDIEVFFLPHRPAVKVADEVEKIAAEFKNVTLKRYSFDDEASHALIEKYGITGHLPVAIFIDGKSEFKVNGKTMTFQNFPKSDTFIPSFGGSWDYADLRSVLAGMTD